MKQKCGKAVTWTFFMVFVLIFIAVALIGEPRQSGFIEHSLIGGIATIALANLLGGK